MGERRPRLAGRWLGLPLLAFFVATLMSPRMAGAQAGADAEAAAASDDASTEESSEGAESGDEASKQEPPEDEPAALLVIDGRVFQGEITSIDFEGVHFTPVVGKGTIVFAFDDIDLIQTSREHYFLYGEGLEAHGVIFGIEGDSLVVGDSYETAERIPFEAITAAVPFAQYGSSFLTRMRVRYRYWSANLTLGMEFEEGAVDKNKVNVNTEILRRRAPTRLSINAVAAFETQKKRDEAEITTKQEIYGRTKYDHDLALLDRSYATMTFLGEHDGPRKVNARLAPAAGLGYRIIDSDRNYWSINLGLGWVYEDFDGSPNNDYAAGLIETEWRYRFWRESQLLFQLFYMPGLAKPDRDWLLRTSFQVIVPIWDPIAVQWSITNTNDNNPAPDTGNNKIVTAAGLTFLW